MQNFWDYLNTNLNKKNKFQLIKLLVFINFCSCWLNFVILLLYISIGCVDCNSGGLAIIFAFPIAIITPLISWLFYFLVYFLTKIILNLNQFLTNRNFNIQNRFQKTYFLLVICLTLWFLLYALLSFDFADLFFLIYPLTLIFIWYLYWFLFSQSFKNIFLAYFLISCLMLIYFTFSFSGLGFYYHLSVSVFLSAIILNFLISPFLIIRFCQNKSLN